VDVERPPLGLYLGGRGRARAEQEDDNGKDATRSTGQVFLSAGGIADVCEAYRCRRATSTTVRLTHAFPAA
jgi:hypothetical protein